MREVTGWELEDVEDIRTYSAAVVRNRFHELPEGMREEARQEAICLVYELHGKWDSEKCPSFRDYLSTYLYLRLVDWWRSHRAQVGGIKVVDPVTGEVTYKAPTIPLSGIDPVSGDAVVDVSVLSDPAEVERLGDHPSVATTAMPWIMRVSEERRPRVRWLCALQALGLSEEDARVALEKSPLIANDPMCRGRYPRNLVDGDMRIAREAISKHFTVELGDDSYAAAVTLGVDRGSVVDLSARSNPRFDPEDDDINDTLEQLNAA